MPSYRSEWSFGRIIGRAVFVVSILFNLSVGVLAVWFLFKPGVVHVPMFHPHKVVAPPSIEYKDFVSILLTALGVMIALGSGLIAVVAILGYSEGRKMVEGLVSREVARLLPPALARAQMDLRPSDTTAADADAIARAAGDTAHGA